MKKNGDNTSASIWKVPNDQTAGLEKIREFQNSSVSNRRCADCGEIPAPNVVLTLGTFVCNSCAVIHLELANKCVNINLFNWTSEKADEIKAKGGNSANNLKYPPPIMSFTGSEQSLNDLRELIHTKYSSATLPSNGPQQQITTTGEEYGDDQSRGDSSTSNSNLFCLHDPFALGHISPPIVVDEETNPSSKPAPSLLDSFLLD